MTQLYNAQALHHTKFSLIAVYGATDTARPKKPAISWEQYQRDRTDISTIESWCSAGYQLAVVTGRLSGVVVMDFDTAALWESFKASYVWPLVQHCLMVQSRRGYHVYIPVSDSGPTLSSHKGDGWDFLAEGRYVIAPGAVIAGHKYSIISGDINALGAANDHLAGLVLAWVQLHHGNGPAHSGTTYTSGQDLASERLSIEAARALYRSWAAQGRNHALYITACLLRDHFYDEADAIEALADEYTSTPAKHQHTSETPAHQRNTSGPPQRSHSHDSQRIQEASQSDSPRDC